MEPMPMQYEQQPPPVYMEQPKTPLQGILANLSNLQIQVLKEPRGFIKVLQFIFGISAFATTTSFSTSFAFTLRCSEEDDKVIKGPVAYPFDIDSLNQNYEVCGGKTDRIHIMGNFSSDARFFVAVGVLAFLYIIAAVILYTLFSHMYDNNPLVPLGDCAMHVLFAILWLAGSSAWSNSITNLGWATDVKAIISENADVCGETGEQCIPDKEANYSKLVISIILGFLNVFLWASNLWFLYKETHFFKAKQQDAEAVNNMGAA